MKLQALTIFVDKKEIRKIKFNSGLNLILNKRNVGRSGNSVGKSTLARVVDYLFMGSINPVYIDEEFKKANERIEALFKESRVEAQLEFLGVDDLQHILQRNLCVEGAEKEFYVDGAKVNESDYEEKIQSLCFDVFTRRPSVRFVAPKFMRNDSHKMLNTTKFLDQHVSSKDYSELFLYLFGFQNTAVLTEKREVTNLVTRRKKQSAALNAIVKEQKPSSGIPELKAQTQALEKDLLKFEYSPKYKDPIARLSEIQADENKLVTDALEIDRKVSNINRTIAMLEAEGGNHLVNEMRAIYEYAGASVEGALKGFEEVLSFHDMLVARKRQFVSVDLPELTKQKSQSESSLERTRREKLEVFANLRSEESVSRITENLQALGELKLKLGRLDGLIEQQQRASYELDNANLAQKKVLAKIAQELDVVNKFGLVFNKHFKAITQKTHAEPYEFTLEFNEETGNCVIDIENKVSNPEGGKKKAEVIAYDMAYIWAADELGLKRPRFVFHDSIEDIDQKQIDAIFSLSEKMPGQQVVSMLSDKLTDDMYQRYLADAILLLSEDDMFFRC